MLKPILIGRVVLMFGINCIPTVQIIYLVYKMNIKFKIRLEFYREIFMNLINVINYDRLFY